MICRVRFCYPNCTACAKQAFVLLFYSGTESPLHTLAMETGAAPLWSPEEPITFPVNLHYPSRRNEDICSGMLVLVLLLEFLKGSKDRPRSHDIKQDLQRVRPLLGRPGTNHVHYVSKSLI